MCNVHIRWRKEFGPPRPCRMDFWPAATKSLPTPGVESLSAAFLLFMLAFVESVQMFPKLIDC